MEFTNVTGNDLVNILDGAFNIITEKRKFDEDEVSNTIESLRPFQNLSQARVYSNSLKGIYRIRMGKEYVQPNPVDKIS